MITKKTRLSKADLQILSRKNILRPILDVFLDWSIIGLCMYMSFVSENIFIYFLSALIIGNKQHALAILGHEGSHFTLFASKKWNDLFSNIFLFFPLGLSVTGYRNLHSQHHRHMNTSQDPELMHRSSRAPQWDLPITLRKLARLAVYDIFGYSLVDFIMIVKFSKPDHKRTYLEIIAFHVVFITTFLLLGLWSLIALWYASLITSFMMYFRLRTWLEHQGTEGTHKTHLSYIERALLSPHNAWYHYEHHTWPSVPYYNLPHLREIIDDEPTIPLKELFASFRFIQPIKSGQPLKNLQLNKETNHA